MKLPVVFFTLFFIYGCLLGATSATTGWAKSKAELKHESAKLKNQILSLNSSFKHSMEQLKLFEEYMAHSLDKQHIDGWAPPSNAIMDAYRHAGVGSDHPICSDIGRDIMMHKGGNAVDATIATYLCIGVTTPQSIGIGGGHVMTIYDAKSKSCHIIDGREVAPLSAHRDMFDQMRVTSLRSLSSTAVPGDIAGLWKAYELFGSKKVSWKDLVMPSAELAQKGFAVTEHMAESLKQKLNFMKQPFSYPTMKDTWFDPETKNIYQWGDLIKFPKLANTLKRLAEAENPVELFYKGEFADEIAEEMKAQGGFVTKEDLEKYEAMVRAPLYTDGFSGSLRMCGPPPPTSYVITQAVVSVMMKKCAALPPEQRNRDNLEFYHWLIEAQKFAFVNRAELGDTVGMTPEEQTKLEELLQYMTSEQYMQHVLDRMPESAQPDEYYTEGGPVRVQKDDKGTANVSVLDRDGNGVSITGSVNARLGALVESKLGFIYNSQMDDFLIPARRSNNPILHFPSKMNYIEPGKRPMTSFSPMVVFDKETGQAKIVVGAAGSTRIISVVANTILRVLCFNETIKEAIDGPIIHNQFTPNEVIVEEDRMPKELIEQLREKYGHKVLSDKSIVATQGIVKGEDGIVYVSGDFRRKTNLHPSGFK